MIHTHPLPLCVVPVLLSAVPLLVGLAIARRRLGLFIPLVLTTVVLEATLGSYFFGERVTVTETGIVETSGWWFAPEEYDFGYDSIRHITIEPTRNADGDPNFLWHFEVGSPSLEGEGSDHDFANRPTMTFDPNTIWDLHCDAIIETFRERGITVSFTSAPGSP